MSVATMRAVELPSGETLPVLGLGTWHLGEGRHPPQVEIDALRTGLDLGMALVDTAEMYGDGATETLVGRAIAGRRDGVFLVSKVMPHHATFDGTIAACEGSLRRLGTDRLDLYLLHWRGSVPLDETVGAFDELKRAGRIRHWGVSNFDVGDLDEMLRLPGAAACAANQVYYSLSERGAEFDLLPRMLQQGMPLMAYCPIDGGRIAQHARLGRLAASLNLPAAQLALAWLLRQRGIIAIPKAGREAHLLENWQSQAVAIPDEVWPTVDALFPKPTRKRSLAMR